jgi:hypothetical protein
MLTSLFQYAKFGFGNDSVNGAATRWVDAKLVLITAAPPASPNPLSSDFVAATFDGYADATIAATTYDLHIGQDGQVIIRTPVLTFTCTADNDSDPVIGWALMNTAKDNVLAACIFDTPVPMLLNNQQLILTAQINIPTTMDQPNTVVLP